MIKLKICGVTDPQTATAAIDAGVDYIGLIFHKASRRHVTPDQAVAIATAVHQHQGLIVPVFVDQSAAEILSIAELLQADLLQLHGATAIAAYSQLTAHYPCIIAMSTNPDVTYYDSSRDFLLYDNPIAGSGQTFDWNQQVIVTEFRSFIAGGIDIDNAQAALTHFNPYALDVSTGAENEQGLKDMTKISQLCHCIKRTKSC